MAIFSLAFSFTLKLRQLIALPSCRSYDFLQRKIKMRTDQKNQRVLTLTAAVLSALAFAGCGTMDKPGQAKAAPATGSTAAASPTTTPAAAEATAKAASGKSDAAKETAQAVGRAQEKGTAPAVEMARQQEMPQKSARLNASHPKVRTIGGSVPMPLQPLADKPTVMTLPGTKQKIYYVPSTLETTTWGYLPNASSKPVLTVPSGSTVVFDTLSHEGILEDQGRDPVKYFSTVGVPRNMILNDAIAIAGSDLQHDFAKDGPHVVTGPIAVEGAQPGDVLKVEVLSIVPRVPYGVVSNRHGKGALVGEFPENAGPKADATAKFPDRYANVSIFTPIRQIDGKWHGIMMNKNGQEVKYASAPFMGIMGVSPDTNEKVHSVPPAVHGGNLDINDLVAGTTLYLPVFVPGANFYTGDPHMAQGDGEVALTAQEHSLRPTFRITVLKKGDPQIPSASGSLKKPFGESPQYWMPIGLHPDLDEAMKDAVRESIRFLSEKLGMDRATAYAYLSAATDYEVSQVVDRTKGVHALIRKSDFPNVKTGNRQVVKEDDPSSKAKK
jgi:acetamidase/formamidase